MGAESLQRLAIFENLLLKQCILRHISAKIQPQHLKQYFDWRVGGPPAPLATTLVPTHITVLKR